MEKRKYEDRQERRFAAILYPKPFEDLSKRVKMPDTLN